jgi:hypothetical protein
MSEVKTDKLSPRTASGTVTLGTSGDTFSIPSGGALDVNGTINLGSATVNGLSSDTNLQAAFQQSRDGGYYILPAQSSWQKLPVNEASSVTEFDYANGFDGTNNRWVCPSGQAGTYAIGHHVGTHGNNGSHVYFELGSLYKNGTQIHRTIVAGATYYGTTQDQQMANFGLHLVELAVGDYVEFYVWIDWVSTSNRVTSWDFRGFKLT